MKTKYILTLMLAALMNVSCSDFLDREPLDQFDNDNIWTSENNVSIYAFNFYEQFVGYGNGDKTKGFYFNQFNDDMVSVGLSDFLKNVPAKSDDWKWETIRRANNMIEKVPTVNMSKEAKMHWIGVARFFRAFDYFEKTKKYGDLPWINKVVAVEDDKILNKGRDSRVLVMDSVLADLDYASTYMYADKGDNRVNANTALALKSRVCLYEGTFRKYHKISGGEKFLQASKEASLALMKNTKFKLCSDYRSIYNSVDLSKNSEIILYKTYLSGVLTHGISGFLTSSTVIAGLNKGAVESYVCKDGLPISQSTLYKGDRTIANVLDSRDTRLNKTIDNDLCYVNHTYKGTTSTTGYKNFKFVNEDLQPAERLSPANPTDAPIFWLAEVYLNYAEACAELGNLTQQDLDLSINLLRARSGVSPLKVIAGEPYSGLNGNTVVNDPKRDLTVNPMLWEIRRERRVELMMDGFRYDDLMRWAKGIYLDTTYNPELFLGANIKDTYVPDPDPAKNKIVLNAQGYIVAYSRTRTFDESKHYFLPIPSSQTTMNPALTQNPIWK